ncbi:MAG: AfsR/SARP family transcriptional regulator [Pseudonocardiaceae bacterium]|nr:AfsR/SARP family transcriptional regulator [Pseudonocardiaceae bacterium]
MRFGVLGPLAVWTDEGAPVAVPGVKVRALLADLLIHAGEPVSTDRLVDELWGGAPPSNPAGALQAKVSQLRRCLEQAEPGARALVVSRPSGYALQAADGAVDVARFEALSGRARAATEPRSAGAMLTEALAIWRGPALSDFADDGFAQPAITRLEEQRMAALEEHAEARLALGEHGVLVGELDAVVAEHPLRERLRAAHMRALYRAGRQAEALDSYQLLRTRLSEELGLDPGPELARLHHAILTHDPALAAPVPGSRPRTNLPAPLSSLVGRSGAVADVRKLLDTGRLVTLTGPGGVGKTRLAMETAAQLVDDLPDGAWVVELAGRDDPWCGCPADLAAAAADAAGCLAEFVASTIGVRDDAALTVPPAGEHAGLAERLPAALRDKALLLVLDNCEHSIDVVAELAELLLRSVPRLRILATSREPLGLTGELLSPVPALELPGAAEADLDALARCSAVALFVARADAATPGFALTGGNAAAVVAICRRLDGLPLALELAAARLRVLPVHELAARLDDRFRLLAAGTRDAPARQQTLRAVVDWSWELLGEGERTVLRRLSVFADAFTLPAAEAVCAGDGMVAEDVLDPLARLVDRSLVVAEDGGARYRLLETIAAYALERLDEAAEPGRVRHRHARWYADLAEEADGQLRGHDQQHWLRRLDDEIANCRSALAWAVAAPDAELALRLAGALTWYWFLRGRHSEGRRSLTMALSAGDQAADGQVPDAARARALAGLAGLGSHERTSTDPAEHGRAALQVYAGLDDPAGTAHAQWLLGFVLVGGGEPASGAGLLEEALAGFRRLGDRWGVAATLSVRGWEALRRGELPDARRDGEESWWLFGEVGDRWGQVRSADLLGVLAEIEGDYDRATPLHHDGLRLAEELGLWPVVAQQLGRLGRLAALTGDYPAALVYHERALRLGREQAFEPGVTFAQVGVGLIARRQGRLDDAEEQLLAVLESHRVADFHPGVAFVLAELGFVAELRGDAESARVRHLDGLASARVSGDPRATALALEGLAGAGALAGEHESAAVLLGAADAARRSVDRPLPAGERIDVDRISGSLRAALGEDRYAAAFARGESLGPTGYLAALDART